MDGEPEMISNGTNYQDSFKRKADTVDINGGEDSRSRLKKKARLRDPITTKEIDDINDDLEELNFLQIRLRPKLAFRRPPSPPSFQQCENLRFSGPAQQCDISQQREETIHSSRSQVGDNQDNPLVLEDDEGPDQNSGLTSATGKESEVDITSPKERQDQCTSTPKGRQGQRGSVLNREEWEIERIVDKRHTRRGYEYKVRWQDTWLLGSELGNARGLLQQFNKEPLSAAATPTGEDG